MINSKKLIILRSYLKQVQNDMYDLSTNLDVDDRVDAFGVNNTLDDVFSSLDFAFDHINSMIADAEWEQKLIADNETLHGLWKEYKMVRDLIGSEE